MNSRGLWAPELHRIGGKWFIYYAADNGKNENHRMWVLESSSDTPYGPYICRGALDTQGWAIDGSPFEFQGHLYFVWSGWPGEVDGQQNIYIAPMSSPWELAAPRTLLVEPTESWEKVDMAICEGPQILVKNGRLFMIYSASGSWTVDYCLGLASHQGGDILDPANWQKTGPVFTKSEDIWGVGHCSFVKSQCQTEDWILFHAKSDQKKGWNDRHVLAQQFNWTEDGRPHFGTPVLK
jgi:GH43 family beta-xylosidase